METIDITTWNGFLDTFRLPIVMSLIGAVIGHYRKNGVIQMPTVSITYEMGPYLEDINFWLKPLRWLYIVLDFFLFLFGLRFHKSQEKEGVLIDLGFLGDMLIGIGTGIIAKCSLAIVNTPSDFVVISTSLLAGFAGLSYIQSKQDEHLKQGSKDRASKLASAAVGNARSEAAAASSDEGQ